MEDTPSPFQSDGGKVPDMETIRSIVETHRPDLNVYAEFYRNIHQDPEISGMETNTARVVAQHLTTMGYEVHTGIGGHGVVGVLRNGAGKKVLMRAELDALPIQEQTDLPYRSEKRMIDRYNNERPVMHACGHDMNMATLLAAAKLLSSSMKLWNGTILILFQPDEEETGGAKAMVEDGLYERVPVPDLMLGQHIVASIAGTVSIRSGPVLVAADSVRVRVIGGPCEGSINPQLCVDPIPLSMRIIQGLEDKVKNEVGRQEDVTVACWGFHAGEPGGDYVAHADILLDVKTVKPSIRRQALDIIERQFRHECNSEGVPTDPVFNCTVRAPLTSNDEAIVAPISKVFKNYFGPNVGEMAFTRACEDFSTLGAAHKIPYAYWNYGGTPIGTKKPFATNHSPFFAPAIQPTLKTGTDAMALAALAFLVSH
ncbi:hypothetical protein FPOA_11760 [Fusarium poae]|uniref:Peptidase M20 dimerisation domain-containing protein n=1 Tax=Fusarium poae TaxID=36050 RepID=A0A1B8AHL1_FUSPO|nr:hypothetical protein FPOA_11760 [Fusarium poae]